MQTLLPAKVTCPKPALESPRRQIPQLINLKVCFLELFEFIQTIKQLTMQKERKREFKEWTSKLVRNSLLRFGLSYHFLCPHDY